MAGLRGSFRRESWGRVRTMRRLVPLVLGAVATVAVGVEPPLPEGHPEVKAQGGKPAMVGLESGHAIIAVPPSAPSGIGDHVIVHDPIMGEPQSWDLDKLLENQSGPVVVIEPWCEAPGLAARRPEDAVLALLR